MKKQTDRQRLAELKKMLKENLVDSVVNSIELEIKQIKVRMRKLSQAKLIPCEQCHHMHPESYLTPHNGSLICGDCYRAEMAEVDAFDLDIEQLLSSRSNIGNGIEQAQVYGGRCRADHKEMSNRRAKKQRQAL